jgi:TonB-dependent starch-binding outer membrane protein SusC
MPTKIKLHASLLSAFLLLLSSSLFAQTTITGRVLSNSDKQPVIGATVVGKGTKSATTTGSDGSFTLSSATKFDVVTISNIGYATMEVPVHGTTVGDVMLLLSSTSLNDVIVTGYTAQKKKDITGAVAVVVMKDLKSVPGGNTEALLQGQASGVTVVSSGSPGGYSNVRVRGVTTVGNTDPLVIIDGTPGSLHDLNVNDIDQMQVLKDASSAAIYGVRGSNGVIIVTTKKGRNGKATITYDGYYGSQQPLSKGFDIANTQNTGNAYVQSQINAGVAPGTKQFGNTVPAVIPDYITPTYASATDPKTDPATYALYTNQITKANKAGTDWFHEIFKPAPIQSHTISAQGGNEKNVYFFSFGYFNQQGTLIDTYLKRFSVRANTIFNVKNNVRIGENLYIFYKQNPGFQNQNEGNAIGMSYRESPIIPVYDIVGNYAGTGSQGLGNAQNPVANMQRTKDYKNNDWQGTGNAFAEVDFLKHLTVRTQIGGTIDNYFYDNFKFTAYENAENNKDVNGYTENFGYKSNWTWTNTLRYSNIFAEKHNLSVLFGTEAIQNYTRAMFGTRSNYVITNPSNLTTSPDLWTLSFGSPTGAITNDNTNYTSGQPPQTSALWSLFGRIDYAFEDKYILGATLRRDQSSLFANDVYTGYFPSISAGWRISKEGFMGNVTWINDLKIRGGWGKLGSLSNVIPNNYLDIYSQAAGSSYYAIDGASGSAQQGFYHLSSANPPTTWEQDIITNIGFDGTFFNNHFDFTFDWYTKAVSGLLFKASPPATGGGPIPPYINLGDIKNDGYDFSLTYHDAINKDWKLDVTGTFTSYHNIVKSLPFNYVDENAAGGTRLASLTRLQVGHPVGEFFGYNDIGLFANQADVDKAPTQAGKAPGTFQFQDVNGDNKIDAADRTWIGNPNPDFTYGLYISLSYKAFDFSTMFYGSHGNKDFNYVKYFTDFPQVFQGAVSNEVALNSWTPANLGAKVPQLTTSANFSNSASVSSFYVEDGSFLKCKQMQIGYTLPSSILSKVKVDRFRIYVQAANLFQVTKYTGLDPELQSSDNNNNTNFGIDFGNYPANQQTWLVGVSLSF